MYQGTDLEAMLAPAAKLEGGREKLMKRPCELVCRSCGDIECGAWFVVWFFEVFAEVIEGCSAEVGVGKLEFQVVRIRIDSEGNREAEG